VLCAEGVAAPGAASIDATQIAKDCETHFATEGSFLAGRKYSTWIEVPTVTQADAFQRAYKAIATDGWLISSSDEKMGMISAAQSVSYGKGSVAPLVVLVESTSSASKLTATFHIGGGQTTKEETVRAKLCGYLGAAIPK
jgi:hypothetical protein